MLKHENLVSLSDSARFSLLMTSDPNIDDDVWENAEMRELIRWIFHHGSLLEETVDKIATNIAARLIFMTEKKQVDFLVKHNFISSSNLFLAKKIIGELIQSSNAEKIIRGLVKSSKVDFQIIQQLERDFCTTKEQKVSLWVAVFDGIPDKRSEKTYALFKLCQLLPFVSKVTLRVVKKTEKDHTHLQTLLAAA